MSNYRRFITYLFWYENNDKKTNCGFAKVEQRQNEGQMEIHIKNCPGQRETVNVYFFASGEDCLPLVLLGSASLKNHTVDALFKFDCTSVADSRFSLNEMHGIVIPLEDGLLIASVWDDEKYDWNRLCEKEEEVSEQAVSEEEEPALKIQSAPSAEQSPVLPKPWWQQMAALYPKMYPFSGDKSVWGMEIQLRDIMLLPQQYRILGNNSFLLHGYFNYGIILIGYMEQEKKWFIGVPGVFQNQERVLASMFGFPEFRTQQECVQKTGEFGYWYRFLDV